MVLLAAFKVLLHRYTGQEDVLVGSPIAGRTRTEIEGLIGFFLNTLVLRTDVSGDPSFLEVLGRVREVTLGAYAHQDISFEKLLEELQPDRNISISPFFQVMFMLQNAPMQEAELSGLRLKGVEFDITASKFDMTIYIWEGKGGIAGSVLYSTDLFDEDTISRMLGHYRTLLEGIVRGPDQRISALPLLTEEERGRLRVRRNVVGVDRSFTVFEREDTEQSIGGRFEGQVERYPHRIAVKSRGYKWSYEELNREANRVAHRVLEACGEEGEGRVGLLFEHDAPMVAGVLGVLKAGKTYVPLDPEYPQERLEYMLRDSGAEVVVTNSRNLSLAERIGDGRVKLINSDEIGEEGAENPGVEVPQERVAYILYTSGSTGQPKGVMQNHRNVLHFMRVYTNSLHISAEDRLTLFSSYSFDAAVMDIFGALLNGAGLYPVNMKEEGGILWV
jgi:non-ribosomal peptide synthetase component F